MSDEIIGGADVGSMTGSILARPSGAKYRTIAAPEYGRCKGCAFFNGKRKACRRDAQEVCHNEDVVWEKIKSNFELTGEKGAK